jgi:coenzyme PQQ biosynthesis protein PqqD
MGSLPEVAAVSPCAEEKYVRDARVQCYALPDHSVLLFDETTGNAIPLNDSGAQVWDLCDGSRTVEQIVADLASRYDAEPSQIDRDTREFLSVLVQHDLATRRS